MTPGATTPDLELLLGDPHVPGPFDYASILEDDDARRLNAFAETVLTDWGAGAEFTPARWGGRWIATDDLVTRLRPVFRRDPSVGLGYGLTTLMAAVTVWVAGSDDQKAATAARLLRGERIAVGFHEISHGNDLLHNECRAIPAPGGWTVSGTKSVINNVDRAQSVVIMARTRIDGPAARQFSLLMWNKTPASLPHADTAARVRTAGMRGCMIGAAQFDALPIPSTHVIGAEGTALETTLKAFQVTRAVIPALAVGSVEAALDESIRYARERTLYGGRVLDIPHARSLFADALADTLAADALSRAVVRGLHLTPRESFFLTAASKYLTPQLLNDAMQNLSVLAGSTFYARVDPFGIVEKILRDIAVVPIGHAGSMACLSTMVSHLAAWSRRSSSTAQTRRDLFDTEALGPLDFAALGLGAGSSDPLGAALTDPDILALLSIEAPALVPLVEAAARHLDAQRALTSVLPPDAFTVDAAPEVFDIAVAITQCLAAGAVVGTWAACRSTGGPLADPVIVEGCLRRLLSRRENAPDPLPDAIIDRLVAHGERCVAASSSMGVDPVRLAQDAAAPSPRPHTDRTETQEDPK